MAKETLLYIQTKLEEAMQMKLANDLDGLKTMYQTDLLPHVITLRSQHRLVAETINPLIEKKEELYKRLLEVESACDCLLYEAACLRDEVESGQQLADRPPTAETNGVDVDHVTRMQKLDAEEARRKELQKKLAELTEDTGKIEVVCSRKSQLLNQVKSAIEHLLVKAQPVLADTP